MRTAGALALICVMSAATARADNELRIGFLAQKTERAPAFAYETSPEEDGIAGARLGVADNNTTGRFTGQSFVLVEATVDEGESPLPSLRRLGDDGIRLIVADLAGDALTASADVAPDATLLNIGAVDDELRGRACRGNVLHV